jgi:hypothetical protein
VQHSADEQPKQYAFAYINKKEAWPISCAHPMPVRKHVGSLGANLMDGHRKPCGCADSCEGIFDH